MQCEEVRALLDNYIDRVITDESVRAVDAHLLRCQSCACYDAAWGEDWTTGTPPGSVPSAGTQPAVGPAARSNVVPTPEGRRRALKTVVLDVRTGSPPFQPVTTTRL